METVWGWLDETKTIVLVSIGDNWTQQDLEIYADQFWPQIAEQPHTVNVIIDLHNNRTLPLQPVAKLVWLARNRPSNMGRIVVVVKRVFGLAIIETLRRTLQQLYPHFQISGVLTRGEAITLLSKLSAEPPTSSISHSPFEVGHQPRSESPQ